MADSASVKSSCQGSAGGGAVKTRRKERVNGETLRAKRVLTVPMNPLVRVRVKRLAKSSPTLANPARMGHPNSF
jgi:hypothetical protein